MTASEVSSKFEDTLKPAVYGAARGANMEIVSVALDLRNGIFHIVTATSATKSQRDQIREAVREEVLSAYPKAKQLRIRVRSPHPYRFKAHFPISATARAMTPIEEIEEFRLDVVELLSLRAAYDEVLDRSDDFDYVVTFALGGVPAANYISEMAERKKLGKEVDADTRLEMLQNKYHVFPGLNWQTPGVDAKEDLRVWLRGLPKSSSVLFFDTGTVGNGPRQVFNLLDAYVRTDEVVRISTVDIVGIVDGRSEEQRKHVKSVRTRSGEKVKISIDYKRVIRVVTEDCQALLGYDSLRELGFIQPVSTTALFSLTDAVASVGAQVAAPVLSYVLAHKINQVSRSEPAQNALNQQNVAQFILSEVLEVEVRKMQMAAELGLTDTNSARSRKGVTPKRPTRSPHVAKPINRRHP